ncbi:MAG: energy transducer TonB [Deltaproteobacteria bacterium]|nr:energy transducer TonB [Deltaproteobacteria bacterium]
MKYSVLPLLTLLAPLVCGCASEGGGTGSKSSRSAKKRGIVAAVETGVEKPSRSGEMGLQNEIGVYDSADVEETISERMDEVRACYSKAGRARRYAGGKVNLRFIVDGNGTPRDVLVVSTDLGNYEVERCLVDLGRQIKFPPPSGRKATTFEYPVEFRSTREVEVQELDDSMKIDRDVTVFMHTLASCGAVTADGASASFYIEPNGSIGSVGLAGESAFDEQAGACMVREMRRWRMSAALPGRMLRCRMTIPAVIANVEPPPSRRAVLSAAARKRRR